VAAPIPFEDMGSALDEGTGDVAKGEDIEDMVNGWIARDDFVLEKILKILKPLRLKIRTSGVSREDDQMSDGSVGFGMVRKIR